MANPFSDSTSALPGSINSILHRRATLIIIAIVTTFVLLASFVYHSGSSFVPGRLRPGIIGGSLSDPKVVFGGTIVNGADVLQRDIVHYYALASMLKLSDFRIVIVLGKSQDDSERILESFRQADPHHFHFIYDDDHSPSKIHRIVHARNSILDTIQERYPDYDYYFSTDLDDKFPVRAMEHATVLREFLDRSDWDALTFNRDCYYDIYALRTDVFPDDVSHHGEWDTPAFRDRVVERSLYYSNLLRDREPDDWVPVTSAYGGMGIYRLSKALDCRYKGYDEEGFHDCEHVDFHREMISKHDAKIFISSLSMGGPPPGESEFEWFQCPA